MTIEEAMEFLEAQGFTVIRRTGNRFHVTGEGLGDTYPTLSSGDNPGDGYWDTLALNFEQFSDFIDEVSSEVAGTSGVPPEVAAGRTEEATEGKTEGKTVERDELVPKRTGPPRDVRYGQTETEKPPWWPDYLGIPWPPEIRVAQHDPNTGVVTFVSGGFDWGAFTEMKRSFGTSEEERVLSLDDLIAQSLGQVADWSDLDDPFLQKAQRLFDFKKQPTDAERLRLALDIAQSPSDYMTLVGLYTGAVSRESPARMGERVAPLMPYLQQMAQKFFAGTSLTPEAEQPMVAPTDDEKEAFRKQEEATYGRTYDDAQEDQFPGLPPDASIITSSGRYYNPREHTWEPLEDFQSRTGETPGPPIWGPNQWFGDIHGPDWLQPGLPGEREYDEPDDASYVPWSIGPVDAPRIPTAVQSQGEGMGITPAKRQWEYLEEDEPQSFQQGGVVDGDYLGQPKVIKAHAGEMVIPNYTGGSPLQQSGALGDVWRPPASIWGSEVSRPAVRQIPSTIEGGFRFRSPQTIRRMTPSQRMMFQEGVKSFGYPWEDWRMQERLATGAGGAGRPRARFRRPSFVRG